MSEQAEAQKQNTAPVEPSTENEEKQCYPVNSHSVQVELKSPINRGTYKESYIKVGITNPGMVVVGQGLLSILTVGGEINIPFDNVVMWTIENELLAPPK